MTDTALLLHYGDNGIRGSEICLIQTAKAFTEKGFRVVICRHFKVMDAALNELSPKPILVDFRFSEIMLAGFRETSLPLLSYLRSLVQLHRIIKKFKPSLMYCNAGLPCQVAVPAGRLNRVPILCHFHHPAIKRAYFLWLVVLADKVIFPSNFTREHSELKAKISGDVVYNGIDLERFQPVAKKDGQLRSKLGIGSDAVVIGQVGQLVRHKRADFLIHAFSTLLKQVRRPIHLCLVGAGPMQASLEQLVSSLGIEAHVTITGYVDDVLPYYQHVFDINVLVSREEGLGISAIEGSACGLPVLVSRCTGLSETIVENETGLFFEMNSREDLCHKLLLLINDDTHRTTLGMAGRAYSRLHFSSRGYNHGIITAANSVLGRPN